MKILVYLIVIFFTPLVLLLNFRLLVFSRGFYFDEFAKLKVYDQFSSPELVINNTHNLINYLCCNKELEGNFFTLREKLHLGDVKTLIQSSTIFLILLLLIIFSSLSVLIVKRKVKELQSALFWSSISSLISILALWISTLVNFEKTFIKIHYFTFQNDFWQLSPQSNLIKLFPQQFFVDFADSIAFRAVTFSLIIFLISLYWRKKLVTTKR